MRPGLCGVITLSPRAFRWASRPLVWMGWHAKTGTEGEKILLRKLNARAPGPNGMAVLVTLVLAVPILVIMIGYAVRGWLGN